MDKKVIVLTFVIGIINGQKTGGACSPGLNQGDDDNCDITILRQEFELQSVILQEMRSEFIKLKTRDCSDILKQGHSNSGVYEIYQPERTHVYCNMETDGGGWTVILNRQNGDGYFDRTWVEYKIGFGDVSGNHWLGNKYLFCDDVTARLQTPNRSFGLGRREATRYLLLFPGWVRSRQISA